MASLEPKAALNHSDSPIASPSQPRKRPLNGLITSDSSNHHANGIISLQSNGRESIDTHPTAAPEAGRRKRKKTRAFEIPGPTFVRRVSTGALGVSGHGVKLSAIPNIMYAMDKRHAKAPEIEFLHRLLFNSAGPVLKRKSNIRAFSGFVFKSDKDRGRVRDKLMRSHLNLLKRVAVVLDVPVKDGKDSKLDKSTPQHRETEIEMAAEQFLGSDSLASEDINNDARVRKSVQYQRPVKTADGISQVSRVSDRTSADQGLGSSSSIAARAKGGAAGSAAADDVKSEKYLSRQRKEDAARVTKEETVKAILSFLEVPKIPVGRVNLAEQEKEKKRQKKALEKAKAQKALLKKAEEKRKQLLAKNKASESDEDGDEDLEIDAKPWIVLARERQERDEQLTGDREKGSDVLTNGHS